ncbi:MAG: hypothetical protein IT581_07450 [Verrucomicrobiales bacterium]|nr:hypothetical protein [Verrucomicrobiales bacterium]
MKIPCLVSGFLGLLCLPTHALEAKIEFPDNPGFPIGQGAWFDYYEYDYEPGMGWSGPDFFGGDDWNHALEFRIVSHQLAPGTLVDVVITYEVELTSYLLGGSYNYRNFQSQTTSTSFLGRDLDGPGTYSCSILVTAPVGEWTYVDAALTGMGLSTVGLQAIDPSLPASAMFSAHGDFHYTSVKIPLVPDAGSSLGLFLLGTASLVGLARISPRASRL